MRALGLTCLLVLCQSDFAARELRAGEEGPAPSAFAPAVSGWQSRSAAAIRKLIPEAQRLSLRLEGTGDEPIKLNPLAEQAEAILKVYFSKVEGVTLKDVTSAESRSLTRTYDYTYRPTGAEARTTRLSITLVDLKDGKYGLVGFAERPKK